MSTAKVLARVALDCEWITGKSDATELLLVCRLIEP
jgi:hypothetical protein